MPPLARDEHADSPTLPIQSLGDANAAPRASVLHHYRNPVFGYRESRVRRQSKASEPSQSSEFNPLLAAWQDKMAHEPDNTQASSHPPQQSTPLSDTAAEYYPPSTAALDSSLQNMFSNMEGPMDEWHTRGFLQQLEDSRRTLSADQNMNSVEDILSPSMSRAFEQRVAIASRQVPQGRPRHTLSAYGDQKRRRRECHNAVERRRRDHINDRIQELRIICQSNVISGFKEENGWASGGSNSGDSFSTGLVSHGSGALGSAQATRLNKSEILEGAVEHIRQLHSFVTVQHQQISSLEKQLGMYQEGANQGT